MFDGRDSILAKPCGLETLYFYCAESDTAQGLL